MRRARTILGLVLLLLAVAGACSSDSGGTSADAATDFGATGSWATVGGGSLEAAELAGTDVVAWFWAPW